MKRTFAAALAAFCLLCGFSAQAAVPSSDVTAAYDRAVAIQDEMDSLDVTIRETTMVPGMKGNAQKKIAIQASGLQDLEKLQASIVITADDGEKSQYYSDGWLYTDQTGEKLKHAMRPEEMIEVMNYYIFLDLNSTRLAILEQDGDSYLFCATGESLGDYADKLLEGVSREQQVRLAAVQGTVDTDGANIMRRSLQTVYTVRSGEEPQTCTVNTRETFRNPGQPVEVEFPDLRDYREKTEEQAAVTLTAQERTVYATADVNVRAQNNITSAILGGAALGEALAQTGYTSDGWTQISYNGAVAFVSSEYVSEKRPVVTRDMSGTMYATVPVNVRSAAGTDGAVLGVLGAGDPAKVTGCTSNDWFRVDYKGQTGYVSGGYLTWDVPVTAMGGTMYVANELANIRAYYSTDSEVLATVSKGTAVEVTGYTANNWIAVSCRGQDGYIYGDLLSWKRPQQFSYGYVEGIVSEAAKNSMTLAGDDGVSYSFHTSDAEKKKPVADGDHVGVYYTDRDGTRLATEIVLLEAEPANSRVDDEEGLVYGTVVSSGPGAVTIACDDGQSRTFDREGAYIDCPNGIYVGLYVQAAYYRDAGRGYVLNYLLAS